MNALSLAVIGCRLLAIYIVLVKGIDFVLQAFASAVMGQWGYVLPMMGLALSYLIPAAALWFAAGWFAERIAGIASGDFAEDREPQRWEALAVFAAGWIALLFALSYLTALLRNWLVRPPGSENRSLSELEMFQIDSLILWMFVAYSAVGLVLVFLPRTLVSGIAALRSWAGKPVIERDAE